MQRAKFIFCPYTARIGNKKPSPTYIIYRIRHVKGGRCYTIYREFRADNRVLRFTTMAQAKHYIDNYLKAELT